MIAKKRVNTTFYFTTLVSFLSFAIPLGITLISESSIFRVLIYLVVYANVYLLWPLLGITLLILMFQYFRQLSPLAATKEIGPNILSMICCILIVNAGIQHLKYQNNQLEVVIANRTGSEIKHIKLHGRNALTEIDSLLVNSDTTVIFRGKHINYETENDYENEVTLLYYFESKWRE